MSPAARLRAVPGEALPVAAVVLGREVEAVAALLPRLFNLCRSAQEQAVAVALGRAAQGDAAHDVLRDHLLKLLVTWPQHLGLAPQPLPRDWASDPEAVRAAVYGPAGPPATPAAFHDFLASGQGAAPVLSAIAAAFAPFEASARPLPFATAATLWSKAPQENSIAARHPDSPILAALESTHGRAPLWRATARLLDVALALDGGLPAPASPAPGLAVVAATRGLYGLRLIAVDGRVTDFARITPTDALLAPGGPLEQSLATLDHTDRAPLLLDILDPCTALTLEPIPATEADHA